MPERPRLTPAASLIRLGERRGWTVEERREVLEELLPSGDGRAVFYRRFTILLTLSAAIAAFGLLSNSSAVVIGAMLIAPLMTPILAVSTTLVTGQPVRLLEALFILFAGTAVTIGTGWFVSLIGSRAITSEDLPGEVLARTSPQLLDLGIAICAGAAAGYLLTDRGAASAIGGVAIAVALVPPLATVGIVLEVGASADAWGAMLLFLTNLNGIVIAASAVLLASGFVDRRLLAGVRRRVRYGLAVTAFGVVAVSVPLAVHTNDVVQNELLSRQVVDAVEDLDPKAEVVRVEAERRGSGAQVELVIAAPSEAFSAQDLAQMLEEQEGLSPVEVGLAYRRQTEQTATAS